MDFALGMYRSCGKNKIIKTSYNLPLTLYKLQPTTQNLSVHKAEYLTTFPYEPPLIFAVMYFYSVSSNEMVPSPFHGIFSFGDTQGGPFAQSKDVVQATEIVDPAPTSHVSSTAIPASQKPMGQIAVDIYEQDDYYIVRAPIAGVRLSDLDIEVDDKVLTIRGTRRVSDAIPENQFYLQECFWGDFSRSITMPFAVDPKKIKATFSKDSILKIIIPKEERVKIIRINEGS